MSIQLHSSLTTFQYDFRTTNNSINEEKRYFAGYLCKQVDTSGDIIGRYERDEVKPSIEIVVRLADALGVSLDFLVGKTELELDNATINRMREVTALPDEDRKQVFMVVDALIRDFKAKKAYAH